MLERLEQEFVNVWVLHRDLQPLIQQKGDAELARVAKIVAEAYRYPVDSLVLSPEGKLLDRASANEVMIDEARYLKLLDAARAGR